jgi:hypothetical protein
VLEEECWRIGVLECWGSGGGVMECWGVLKAYLSGASASVSRGSPYAENLA